MKKEPLWYIRRAGEVTGPYTAGLVERYVMLGRVDDASVLSPDKVHWAVLAEWPEWAAYLEKINAPEISDELMESRRRWEDERGGYDRRAQSVAEVESNQRSRGDRRHIEATEEIKSRQHRHQRTEAAKRYSLRAAMISIVVLVIFVSAYLALYRPSSTQILVDCSAQAAESLNWSYCDLQNLELTDVSLRHSNLQSANLTGAILDGVDLSASDMSFSVLTLAHIDNSQLSSSRIIGVSFRNSMINNTKFDNSDLTYADFSNAEFNNVSFEGARLDYAIWLDRRRCAAGSVGICR